MGSWQKHNIPIVTLVVVVLSFQTQSVHGQILNSFSEETHGSASGEKPATSKPATSKPAASKPAAKPKRKVRRSSSGSLCLASGHNRDAAGNLVGELALIAGTAAVSAPFLVPRAALGDEGQQAVYPDYPYDHDGELGAISYDETLQGTHHSLIVLQAVYGSNLDDVNQFQGRIFGDLDLRLGFDSETSYFTENTSTDTDDFWRGDFNLTWRFAQNEHWQFRAGVGMNWMHDSRGGEAGINGTYNIEWFPADPWVLSSSLDVGSLGGSGLLHTRNTIGVTHNGWGIFTGHDYFKLDSTRLHTWITGFEYRF